MILKIILKFLGMAIEINFRTGFILYQNWRYKNDLDKILNTYR